jgi:hypothetical protein
MLPELGTIISLPSIHGCADGGKYTVFTFPLPAAFRADCIAELSSVEPSHFAPKSFMLTTSAARAAAVRAAVDPDEVMLALDISAPEIMPPEAVRLFAKKLVVVAFSVKRLVLL